MKLKKTCLAVALTFGLVAAPAAGSFADESSPPSACAASGEIRSLSASDLSTYSEEQLNEIGFTSSAEAHDGFESVSSVVEGDLSGSTSFIDNYYTCGA